MSLERGGSLGQWVLQRSSTETTNNFPQFGIAIKYTIAMAKLYLLN